MSSFFKSSIGTENKSTYYVNSRSKDKYSLTILFRELNTLVLLLEQCTSELRILLVLRMNFNWLLITNKIIVPPLEFLLSERFLDKSLAWIIRGILGAGPSTDVGSDSVFLSHGGL
jgi:hypothetical protein